MTSMEYIEARKCLSNSGYATFKSSPRRGVKFLLRSEAGQAAHAPSGTASSMLANRVSWFFDWHGPSEAIDTACSSSLVAVHRAIQAIYSGDCGLAIAGGVSLTLTPDLHLSFGKAGMLSKDGRCKTFDEKADGYVRGEGVGAILLKPMDQAVRDGNNIYGVVKGSAINHGGRVSSLTVPNPNAQAKLIAGAHQRAGVSPDSIGYIECHGTGTALGDPIEIRGLKKAFAKLYQREELRFPDRSRCGLGSVKTNIGHLEAAAGIAGLIKALLAFQHKKLPKTVHFQKLNPHIELEKTPFYIISKLQDWRPLKDESGHPFPLRAGVSSFGFGGANAHVVLEEYRTDAAKHRAEFSPPYLILLSARSEERLKVYGEKLIRFLQKTGEKIFMGDLAYTLQVGREAMEKRMAILAEDSEDLSKKLEKYLKTGEETTKLYIGDAKKDRSNNEFLVEGKEGAEFIHSILIIPNTLQRQAGHAV